MLFVPEMRSREPYPEQRVRGEVGRNGVWISRGEVAEKFLEDRLTVFLRASHCKC